MKHKAVTGCTNAREAVHTRAQRGEKICCPRCTQCAVAQATTYAAGYCNGIARASLTEGRRINRWKIRIRLLHSHGKMSEDRFHCSFQTHISLPDSSVRCNGDSTATCCDVKLMFRYKREVWCAHRRHVTMDTLHI